MTRRCGTHSRHSGGDDSDAPLEEPLKESLARDYRSKSNLFYHFYGVFSENFFLHTLGNPGKYITRITNIPPTKLLTDFCLGYDWENALRLFDFIQRCDSRRWKKYVKVLDTTVASSKKIANHKIFMGKLAMAVRYKLPPFPPPLPKIRYECMKLKGFIAKRKDGVPFDEYHREKAMEFLKNLGGASNTFIEDDEDSLIKGLEDEKEEKIEKKAPEKKKKEPFNRKNFSAIRQLNEKELLRSRSEDDLFVLKFFQRLRMACVDACSNLCRGEIDNYDLVRRDLIHVFQSDSGLNLQVFMAKVQLDCEVWIEKYQKRLWLTFLGDFAAMGGNRSSTRRW